MTAALMAGVAGCGDDAVTSPSTPTASGSSVSVAAVTSTASAPSTASATSAVVTTSPPTTQPAATTAAATTAPTPPTTAVQLEQPAIWPAADVVFDSPVEAAEDFVATVLGVPPSLGEFRQGDNRSGEIEVFSPGEGGAAAPVFRSLLLLRQLGPSSGWFVTAALNENASIGMPAIGDLVPAGALTVTGVARGFEANVNVTARVAGEAAPLAEQITMGGSMDTPEPFSVTLDLSPATPGQVVMLLVRGGVGLETDPGDFGAIPVVVG